ncbi:alpha-ribazole phosphatase [Chryseobacterium sp. 52]|uniref:alpha-ribazole phosphatase family protein n=1 Tax=Chryseobacterium sp. 52 TaxID=2035213 RepID=UPI000C1A56AA|nr:alpha-ribazole phosphatase family protein [Chryseobacterium sp. 52]PIF44824.1 alpha-ribazole phosphatase [Chryseobacterium sp. 52]
MEIHLIRHTAVENPENLCYGFSDIPLRNDFAEDCKAVHLDENYDRVISSPSKRCILLAEHFKLNYKTDERLREMNFGNWELKKWAEIPEEEINPWYKDFINIKASGGENLTEMQTRILSFWNELCISESPDKVLLITHAGVIRLIIQSILEFPLENIFKIQIDYGKKVIIHVKEGFFSVTTWNV